MAKEKRIINQEVKKSGFKKKRKKKTYDMIRTESAEIFVGKKVREEEKEKIN